MKPCFARMKNFLTSFSQHVGSGGGGCVFASRSSRPWPGNFLSYQELVTKRKMGRASLHFVALGTTPPGPSRREEGAGTAAGKRGRAGDGERAGRAAYGPSADQPYIKKGRPPYDGRPDVQQRKGPTGPDPPARGSLPDLPGTCPDVPSGRAR